MRVLQYSVGTLPPEPHHEGTIRVSLDGDRVLTHLKTGRIWVEKDLGPDTEKVLSTAFILPESVDVQVFDGSSEEASEMKLHFIREHTLKLHFLWYSRKPGEKWELVNKEEEVPIETRCLLKARCAARFQDMPGMSPKLEAR
jgi:hypothetical protein